MTRTASELANAIGAKIEGDGAVELRGVAAPERAGPHDLIYVEKEKHAERAAVSSALCVIAGDGVAVGGKTVLRHSQPKVAFAKAAALLLGRTPIAAGIHATARAVRIRSSSSFRSDRQSRSISSRGTI